MNEIESKFYSAFIQYAATSHEAVCEFYEYSLSPSSKGKENYIDLVIKNDNDQAPASGYFSLWPQHPAGRYFIDFALLGLIDTWRVSIAVEIDGHEFHEKTKEQVARDKRRDSDLSALGFVVLRFSGAEIYHNPAGCVHERIKLVGERYVLS